MAQVGSVSVAIESLTAAFEKGAKRSEEHLDALEKAVSDSNKKMSGFAKTMDRVAKAGASLFALGAIKNFGAAIIDTATKFQRLDALLAAGTQNAEGFANALGYVQDTANALGQPIEVLQEQYAKFSVAATGAGFSVDETRKIFEGMTKASTALGLSSHELEGALNAVQQMMSKGRVSAEELRGQLAERLPGAFGTAARAIGVTEAELNDLLETGSLTAQELLPALARELENLYGAQAAERAQSLGAQITILNNAFAEAGRALAQSGIIEYFAKAVSWIAQATQSALAFFGIFNRQSESQVLSRIEAISSQLSNPFLVPPSHPRRQELELERDELHIQLWNLRRGIENGEPIKIPVALALDDDVREVATATGYRP